MSAGFDAHERDPLASMRMTTHGYAAIVGHLRDVAARHGALALVTEGGYDLTALAECLEASFSIVGRTSEPLSPIGPSRRGERAVTGSRAALKRFWHRI